MKIKTSKGYDDYERRSLEELKNIDFTTLDDYKSYDIDEDNFPDCTISRRGDKLIIRMLEQINTKYWIHKFHASVFAEAMMKAIKRLKIEGYPFLDEYLDEYGKSHILHIGWSFSEPLNIDINTLAKNINLAFDSVFERANSMLENSDSVLILGKDTGEGFQLLKRIQSHLDNIGFYTYIIKEQPDKIGESIIQKVLRFGLSSRFVIIENSEPSGHLYEFPNITKFAELTSIVLQRKGEGSTWMFEDLYQRLQNIKKFEYTNENLEEQINIGIDWANRYLKSFGDYQKQKLPWLNEK